MKPLSFLLLGDGDFTYSLDLARYLSDKTKENEKKYHLIATGIDSKDQLFSKYKDSPFVLQQLLALSSNIDNDVTVTVVHEVNAILSSTQGKDNKFQQADHVMFHHPHVGTEDSSLHQRFLSHLFYSVKEFWIRQGAVFHLSLVLGQCERWKCLEAANRHGLTLLGRKPFQPPPVKEYNGTYHYRRHQTGKSFESRRPQKKSETLSFGRIGDSSPIADCLPWQEQPNEQLTISAAVEAEKDENDVSLKFICPFCQKSFKEERSRKCHIRDKHPDGPEKKPKTGELDLGGEVSKDTHRFICYHCKTEDDTPRIFNSGQALQDHVQAKHSAIHKIILPDWYQQRQEPEATISLASNFGSCNVCGLTYQSERHKLEHMNEFIPKEPTPSFHCRFCSKSFREKRANQQHENFCSKRTQ